MEVRKTRKQTMVSKRARPIRELLQTLVRDRIKTKLDKQKLADFLEQSVGSIDAMLYKGEGGLDSWISALMFCYDMNPSNIKDFILNHQATVRRNKAVRESDKRWFDLDSLMTEDEKFYWVSLITTSIRLQKELTSRKKKSL
jgi:hypothetical protein